MKKIEKSFGKGFTENTSWKKRLALAEIAIVLCLVFLVALPAIAADQTTQKVGACTITADSEEYVRGPLDVFGNANEDGTIDMRDTTYIKLVIFGKKPKTDLADANNDGKVSMLDVGQTKLIILGKEKKLTLIDLADRTVTINKPIERVVLGSARHMHEFVAVEGGEDPFKKIVGWGPDLKAYDRDTYNKYIEKFPEIEDIPEVGYHYKGTFSVEKVITLNPDVVVFPLWIVEYEGVGDDINKLEKAGIPVIYIDYYTKPFENPVPSTLLLGYVLDKEERAQDIVNFYKEQSNEVYSRIERIDKPKPKVYVECGSKEPSEYGNTYGSDKGWGAVVVICGGINIAEDIPGGPINPEYLLDANPDVIMISGSYWPATPGSMRLGYYADPKESRELLTAFTKRPGWDTLNAVKNNRVCSIFHGFSFRIYNFAGLQAFAKWFYPDEFTDLDPEERLKEFHERFLPVDYSGVWMLSLEE